MTLPLSIQGITTLILSALYFMLPGYFANMAPIFAGAAKLPWGKSISERLFGIHKTYRGFVAGYAGALVALLLQRWLQSRGMFQTLQLLDYQAQNLWLLAFLFGVGALTGDLVKSFFKRRIGMPEGRSWVPFDQIDLVIGALVFLLPVFILDLPRVLILFVFTPFLHLLTNLTGYALGLKKVWW